MRSKLVLIIAIILLLGCSMSLFAADLNNDGLPDQVPCPVAPLVLALSPSSTPTYVEVFADLAPASPPLRLALPSFRC